MSFKTVARSAFAVALMVVTCWIQSSELKAQSVSDQTFTFKVYATNYATYPFVMAYFRTFDQNRDPLVNLNYANVGLMVKGFAYDPKNVDLVNKTCQYSIETLENRDESFRTVFVLDASKTMEGAPFTDAMAALSTFISMKRPNDEISVLAVRDTNEGYQIVSNFEKDANLLMHALSEVQPDGMQTRLYDTVGAALEMCATASKASTSAMGTASYPILNSIVVLSDGKDEGSAVQRAELISKINTLDIPIPIFSLAFSTLDPGFFLNLEALSKATFGRYWLVSQTSEFVNIIRKIHQINRGDYVVTFRSYVPVDGSKHPYKIAVQYPSNTGKSLHEAGEFEAIDSTPFRAQPAFSALMEKLEKHYPLLEQGPYMIAKPTPGPVPSESAAIPVVPTPVAPGEEKKITNP